MFMKIILGMFLLRFCKQILAEAFDNYNGKHGAEYCRQRVVKP